MENCCCERVRVLVTSSSGMSILLRTDNKTRNVPLNSLASRRQSAAAPPPFLYYSGKRNSPAAAAPRDCTKTIIHISVFLQKENPVVSAKRDSTEGFSFITKTLVYANGAYICIELPQRLHRRREEYFMRDFWARLKKEQSSRGTDCRFSSSL